MTTYDDHLPGDHFPDVASMGDEARRELFNAYLDGELSTGQALLVSRWLDSNPGALREMEHLRHLWDLLENYEDEPVPEDFAAVVVEAVSVGGVSVGGVSVGGVSVGGVSVGGVSVEGADPLAPAGRVIPMAWYRRPMATAAAVLIAVGATALLMSSRSPATLFPEEGLSTEETSTSVSRLEALGAEDLESLEFLDVIADADDDTFDALVADGLQAGGAAGHSADAGSTGSGRGG